jgi:hypothetical protein
VHAVLSDLLDRFLETPHRIVRNESYQSPDEGG